MPSPHPVPRAGRRGVLAAGAAAGAAPLLLGADPAAAAGGYRPVSYDKIPLLSRRERHLVSRFSYGITPALADEVRRRGGAEKWFAWQLDPDGIPDNAGRKLERWWPYLAYGPQRLWQDNIKGVKGGWEVMADYQRWVMMRRMRSRAPAPGGDGAVLGGRTCTSRPTATPTSPSASSTATSSTGTRSVASTRCSRRRPPTRRCSSTSTRPSRPSSTPTRTSRASSSRSTPSAPTRCPRTTCRTWRGC